MNKCSKCDKEAVKEGLCKHHFIEAKEEIYLDNSDINNLGIVKWAQDMLPEYMKNVTPEFHKLFYYNFLTLYNPIYTTKWERLLEVISWRESAKSTVMTMIYPAYILAHNGKTMKITVPWYEEVNGILIEHHKVIECKIKEGYIVIVSETGDQAEAFTVRIRDEFTANPMLRYFYKAKIQDAYDAVDSQWTKRAFKFNDCYVLGIGQGMQVRGRVRGANRITLLLADDIYSENNITSPISRGKVSSWWNKAVKNSVDQVVGKVVLMGTIVHEDTIIVTLEKSSMWKTIKIPLMPISIFEQFRKTYFRENPDAMQCILKFDEIKEKEYRVVKQKEYFREIQGTRNWELSWGDRVGLYEIALQFKENYEAGTVDTFYQEMFHIVNSPDEKRFKPEMFHSAGEFDYQARYGYNWCRWPKFYQDWKAVSCQIGVDMSAGTLSGDNGVITIQFRFPNHKFLTVKQIVAKMPMRDVLYEPKGDLAIEMDRSNIERIGWIDETYRQTQFYHPDQIKVGVAGEETAEVDEMRRVFTNAGEGTQILKRKQLSKEGKKEERIFSNLLPQYEAHMVYHAEGLGMLEHELEFLGKGVMDDRADSQECSTHGLQPPQDISMEDIVPKEQQRPERHYVFERHLQEKKIEPRIR